jgi:hypothetical protein
MDPTINAGVAGGDNSENFTVSDERLTEEFFTIFSESILQDEVLEFANED